MIKIQQFVVKGIKVIKQDFFVINQLIQRDKKRNESETFMGGLWDVINPLIYMIVMVLVFGKMFGDNRGQEFPIYVLTGTTLYELFASGTTMCLNALFSNRNFLIKTQLHKNIYVVEKIIFSFQKFMYSLIIYLFVIVLYKIKPSPTWFWVIPDVLLLLIIMVGIGKILAVINVLFADITYFYKIFILLLMYGSAIFYRVDQMSIFMQKCMIINPLYIVITIARESVIDGVNPSSELWGFLLIHAVIYYIVGFCLFKKKTENIVAQM